MKTFALVDCNNFYVSCERVFNPKIRKKPVVVLSNNDGCVVARSQEAKQIGIPMGIPFFKIKHLIPEYDLKAFSSNYALYADMSKRVMKILSSFSPEMEIYSIDEAFLDFSNSGFDLEKYSQKIKSTVFQYTGLPVSIGIAPTKTLAKIAGLIAKRNKTSGIFIFNKAEKNDAHLKNFPVEKIWGVGKKSAFYLKAKGIYTALQLKNTPPYILKSKMGIHCEKMISELNSIVSYPLESQPLNTKQIRSSRTFPGPVKDKEMIKEAVALYASTGGQKLRNQKLKAGCITVFLKSGKYLNNPVFDSETIIFKTPENNTGSLITAALKCVELIFNQAISYKKAGILLGDLCSETKVQSVFFDKKDHIVSDKLMKTFDKINDKFGNHVIGFGSCAVKKEAPWKVRCEKKSPSYTTDWNQIPRVK